MILSRLKPIAQERAVRWVEAPCPLCGGTAADVAFEAQDPTSRDGLIFSVVKCRMCRLHFTNPRPDERTIGRFYPANYKPHHRTGKPARKPARFGWLTGADCPERRGDLGVPPGRLLDFGCGGGSFLARMAGLGWQVTGLDASDDAVDHVREVHGLNAVVGSLPHAELQPGSFDAVTMWHSLEHVHDPLETLREAFKLLAPGGQLLVACPNIAGWPARWFGADWFGLDLPRHLTHFDSTNLRDMLIAARFEVTHLRGVKHSDWMRSSARIAVRRGTASTLQRLARWKPASKIAAWLTYLTGTCDCLLAKAIRPVT